MRFAPTEDQLAFATAMRELLEGECPPDVVRAAWDGGDTAALWAHLSGMGVVGALAPEGLGGSGMDEVDLTVLLVEAGRAAVPVPLNDVAMVAVPALRDHARTASTGESDAEAILAAICSGEAAVAVGLAVDRDGAGDSTTVLVDGAAGARWFLLESTDGLHLVDPDVVEIEPVPSADGALGVGAVSWTPSPATRLVDAPVAAASALDRAALGSAAQLCGLADRMVELTVGYVAERRQFGQPIGSFQAVQHRLADALLSVSFARPLVLRAAVSVATGDPLASVHVSMAKASASDAAETVAAAALQCHGAIGYTTEYELHLFMQRAWWLARRHGGAAWHRRRVQSHLLGP